MKFWIKLKISAHMDKFLLRITIKCLIFLGQKRKPNKNKKTKILFSYYENRNKILPFYSAGLWSGKNKLNLNRSKSMTCISRTRTHPAGFRSVCGPSSVTVTSSSSVLSFMSITTVVTGISVSAIGWVVSATVTMNTVVWWARSVTVIIYRVVSPSISVSVTTGISKQFRVQT